MIFAQPKSNIRTICEDEPDFCIVDGMVVHPRASLEVAPGAPVNVATTLNWAIAQGYIRCVARVTDRELMWDTLQK
jgi:hypothetical protein